MMTTCLKYLVPISCFLFLGATLWPLILVTGMGRTTWTSPIGDRAAEGLQETRDGSDEVSAVTVPSIEIGLLVPAASSLDLEGDVQ